ncbi:unnamed protein product [Prunus armeniaca]
MVVQDPRPKSQDPFLSGKWSSFLDEGESLPLVVFQCGTLGIAHSCNLWQGFYGKGDDLSVKAQKIQGEEVAKNGSSLLKQLRESLRAPKNLVFECLD